MTNITDECQEWDRSRNTKGYGRIDVSRWHNRRYLMVTRLVWEENHGPIPEGMLVCHRCDNPPCINVEHLFLGTTKENYWDSRRKGRARIPSKDGSVMSSKLTEAQVREIRERYSRGEFSHAKGGKMYGVSPNTIRNAVNRTWWKHVD